MPHRILKRFGVKRIALVAMGTLGLVRGFSYIDPPEVPSGLTTLDEVAPLEYWGWVWLIIGATAVAGAFTRHHRVSFIPIMIISAVWASSYMAEWAMNFFSRGVDSRDYITAVSYAAQTLLILAVIRLIDPAEVKSRRGEVDAD